jgi:alkylation response protein AidB-like acyl-CoA dehydrogenase
MSIIERARALAPQFAARASEGEALRTMPRDLVEAARRAGLFRIAVPRSLGGLELDPVSIIEVIEEISRADGAAGWTVLIGNSVSFFAWLEPSATRAALGDHPDVISTGVFGPAGRAVRTGDGEHLVLNGRWAYNSGCVHADWFQVGFLLMEGDEPAVRPDGRPDWRFAYVRREQAEVIDTWRSTGLRGTGSHDVAVHGALIPEALTAMPMFDQPRHESALLEVGFRALTAVLLAGFPLGVARRALDEIMAIAPAKSRWGQEATIAGDHHAQLQLGRAEGALLSARALAMEAFGQAWDSIIVDGTTTRAQQSRMMLAAQQAMEAALRVVDIAHQLAGSSATHEAHPLGRCFRDLHAARQHIIFSGELFAEFARERLAIPSDTLPASAPVAA